MLSDIEGTDELRKARKSLEAINRTLAKMLAYFEMDAADRYAGILERTARAGVETREKVRTIRQELSNHGQ